jgi:NAD(P)H-hydrate epimerase
LSRQRDALALGPGLGTEPETQSFVIELLREQELPAVVDADGLNAVSASGQSFADIARSPGSQLVLTPHPGEAARLVRCSVAEIQSDRLRAARRLATDTGAVVVLKGHRTVIATPHGNTSVNSSGNPGMATAGIGDVLTGMIGAFLARGFPAVDAARLAVFAHGHAGDRAAATVGQEALIAADLLERLPETLRFLSEPPGVRRW